VNHLSRRILSPVVRDRKQRRARSLGIEVPPGVLSIADEVIE
jgi:hypothetical protein